MKKPFYKRWWFIAFAVVIVLAAIGSTLEEPNDNLSSNEKEVSSAESKEIVASTEPVQEEPEEEEEVKEEPKEEVKEEVKKESVPREYKSALKSAETYAKVMYMSKAGIYDQLVSEYGENFPKEAAQYAIDNIEHDWKANALKSAQTYAETMNMSDAAIYDQLISEYGEKFTTEEAQYAIDNLE